jgi:hypothetical protein
MNNQSINQSISIFPFIHHTTPIATFALQLIDDHDSVATSTRAGATTCSKTAGCQPSQ